MVGYKHERHEFERGPCWEEFEESWNRNMKDNYGHVHGTHS